PTKSAEFVVGGITKGKGSRASLGALLLGYWDEGKLRYCGHVGSGFDDRTLAQTKARCEKLRSDVSPFAEEPELHSPTTWVKPDLLRYFAQVSPFMLTHLADRPLTMIRMPEGIAGERFYQKHWDPELPPFARKITIFSEHKDERHDYLLCDNLATLLWLAQSGTLEFHVWHSRAKPGPDAATQSADYSSSLAALAGSILNYPDYVVFDIDPYIYSGKEAP